jgi:hypothetical protein
LLSLVSALWFDENTAKGSHCPNNANCPEFCKREVARLAFLQTNSKFDGKFPQKILGSARQKHGRNIHLGILQTKRYVVSQWHTNAIIFFVMIPAHGRGRVTQL